MAAAETLPPAPRVRVLVINHNSGPWLARCLESLVHQTIRDFEVVVADNASIDQSFPGEPPDTRFLLLPLGENLGFAVGNNLAAHGTRTPWLAMLNPDAIAAPDWLERLLEEAQAHPECKVFGSTQFRADTPEILDGTGDCLSAWGISWRSGYGHAVPTTLPEGEVFAACGAAMMISTELYAALGGFEPRFFCYAEDVDLCFRARLLGHGVWQSSRARVQHAGGKSSVPGESRFAKYHGLRNMFWTHMRCMPWPWLPLVILGLTGLMALKMLTPLHPGQRGAILRAIRDGLGKARPAFSERRHIQSTRRVSTWAVARWLAWNPFDALRRPSIRIRRRSS